MDTLELDIRGDPGSWVGINIADYDMYKRGDAPFITREEVSQIEICAFL
jgi:hypothetical protein